MSSGYCPGFNITWYLPPQVASMPNALYQSIQGKYFLGYADNITYGKGTNAWAALVNPVDSGVVFYVNVYTITDFSPPPIDVQIWFNSQLPGQPVDSRLVTPANTALYPLPRPKVRLQSASNIIGTPIGGINANARRSIPGQTVAVDIDGIFIFPPGGVFAIFLTNTPGENTPGTVRVAFGWWEEVIKCIP